MNEAIPCLKCLPKLSSINSTVFLLSQTFLYPNLLGSNIYCQCRSYFRIKMVKKEIKNKELNRSKKQKWWLGKIHEKNPIPKKFGNKLGTLAKNEHIRYKKEQEQMNECRNIYKNKIETIDIHTNDTLSYTRKHTEHTCAIKSVFNNNQGIFHEGNETIGGATENEHAIEKLHNMPSSVGETERKTYSGSHVNKTFWEDVINELKYHLPFLQPYSITMALNSLSKIDFDDYTIFKLVAEQIDERWIRSFNIKDLTILLLAYSRIPFKYYNFINIISKELLYKLGDANYVEMAHIVYAYMKMNVYDYEVFLHLCEETKYRIKRTMCAEENGMLKKEEEEEEEEEKEIKKIKENEKKKYRYLCLFIYCLGKMKHGDMELFFLINKYISVYHLNNIDLTNLAYTFSIYNVYNQSFYKQFILKSMDTLHSLKPMQKVMATTYSLKFPNVQFLPAYHTLLESMTKEMQTENIYKHPLVLNACINSFSNNILLDFLLEITKNRNGENTSNEIHRAFCLFNLLSEYITFFMKYKKTISSKDYPKILHISVKVFLSTQTSSSKQSQLKIDLQKLESHIDFILDKIITQMRKMHITNLQSVLNAITSEGVIWDNRAHKIKIICDFINSTENFNAH